jgi:hypothetical protein
MKSFMKSEEEKFKAHLKWASKVVRGWPEWKQKVFRGKIYKKNVKK